MADKAAEFWAAFERETGERLVKRCLGRYFSPAAKEGLWGILILTDKALRFRMMPSDNMIFGIIRRPERTEDKAELLDLAIPFGEITSVQRPKQGFLERLFGPNAEPFAVAKSGGELEHFEAESKQGFADSLEKSVAAAGGR